MKHFLYVLMACAICFASCTNNTVSPIQGSSVSVSFADSLFYLYPSMEDGHHYSGEIPFQVSGNHSDLEFDVAVQGTEMLRKEVIMDTPSSGRILLSTDADDISNISICLRVTEKGDNITENWCSSGKIKLEKAYIKLSLSSDEFKHCGSKRWCFKVDANVEYSVEITQECSEWISLMEIVNNTVYFTVKNNPVEEKREGVIRVWDTEKHFFVTYTAYQEELNDNEYVEVEIIPVINEF